MSHSQDDLSLIQIELNRNAVSSSSGPSQIAHQLEAMAAVSRNLEASLTREKTYAAQLREYANQLIARIHALQTADKSQKEQLDKLHSAHSDLNKRAGEQAQQISKIQGELNRYRKAWSDVLSRDKKAQAVLTEVDGMERKIRDLESSLKSLEHRYQSETQSLQDRFTSEKKLREQSEQFASSHRAELQNVLVRLHTSEARFNDMVKELEALQALRKNQHLELAKAEEAGRQKAEIAFMRREEQMNEELDRERAKAEALFLDLEREKEKIDRVIKDAESRLRNEVARVRAEVENLRAQDRARLEDATRNQFREKDAVIARLEENVRQAQAEIEKSRQEVTRAENGARKAELEISRLKNEIATLEKFLEEERRSRQVALDEERKSRQSILQKERDERDRMEGEIHERECRLDALRAELTLTQEVLVGEKRRIREISDRLASYLDLAGLESDEAAFAKKLAELLADCGEMKTVSTEPVPGASSRKEFRVAAPKMTC